MLGFFVAHQNSAIETIPYVGDGETEKDGYNQHLHGNQSDAKVKSFCVYKLFNMHITK